MITQVRLKELFHYDPDTGIFTARTRRRGSKNRIGDVVGSPEPNGYVRITIDNETHRQHRLAWLYMTGEWPKEEIDHENLDKSDNRWTNLREATHLQNRVNRPCRPDNKSGFKGVSAHTATGRWRATINHKHLGLFDSPAEAAAAYRAEAARLFGEFARW